MGSKSKRRHAQKQYNRAQNKAPVPAASNSMADNQNAEVTADSMSPIMTPKEFRKAAKERAKQEKRLKKEQAKKAADKPKEKKEKKPFWLVRFFRWMGRGIASIFSELKKVHWPTFKQVCKSTGIVMGIVLLFGIILFGMWILFGLLHHLLLNGSLSGWTIF